MTELVDSTSKPPSDSLETIYGTEQFKSHFRSLINDPLFSDVVLVVKEESGEDTKFYAHKAILASWSDVFKGVQYLIIFLEKLNAHLILHRCFQMD